MNAEQAILDAVRNLPPEKQQQILAHARALEASSSSERAARKSAKGLWSDLGIDLSAADIDEARREMWKNFPREDISRILSKPWFRKRATI